MGLAPLRIWAVSDGRAGNAGPALGLAEAVSRRTPAEIEVKTIAWKGRIGRLPWFLNPFPVQALTPDSDISAPWPDIWIAAGRATLPLSVRMRRWSQGKCLVVQIQDPRMPTSPFDLVVAPKHDRTHGDNVLPITGSPHRVTPDRLRSELARFASVLEPLAHPRLAVLIGGKSKAHDLSPERASALARDIENAIANSGGSIMATFSRRTPPDARRILSARLGHLPGVIWDGEGENPYFAFLGAADAVLVTEDSTNMATEAAATGKPVFIARMDGGSLKFRLFHQDLEHLGIARPFEGDLHAWTYPPLAETDKAADEVIARADRLLPQRQG
ncbi:MAG: nucleoside-diphosphate sugar epimerase [Alphaproteobacteria bacterium PA2]|nr:MAG: nucleoside-diphosphate sugar epimerase [Alphaproteobacteria bacterium PA2]